MVTLDGAATLEALDEAVADKDGLALIRAVLTLPVDGRIALVSSFGAESAVLLDMAATVEPRSPVIFLDAGKVFLETLAYQQQLCELLGSSDVRHVRPAPLDQALDGFVGWITGRKRFQGGARADLPLGEAEPTIGRLEISPLAHWDLEDIRHYRRLRQLPLHPLVPKGFASVGCRPCTSPTEPGEPPRAGRWRGLDKLECGIYRR